MEDGHSLFDYNIDLNCLVQVMIMPEPTIETEKSVTEVKEKPTEDLNDEKPALIDTVDNNNQEKKENDMITAVIQKVFFFKKFFH